MRRSALITFHRPINFGAALQTVALSRTIDRMGVQCDILDYRNPFFEEMYKPFHRPSKNTIKLMLWSVVSGLMNTKKQFAFRRFVRKNTRLTRPITNKKDLCTFGNTYDLYITGSDQVWNLKCSGNETAYFLDFVCDKPKKAYAASFGDMDISEDVAEQYKKLLSGYTHISVRERSGVELVQRLLGNPCKQTLDPTLLLDMQQWNEVIRHPGRLYSKEYVLIYFMAASEHARKEILEVARKVAQSRNCDILVIGESLRKTRDGIHYINISSPNEFVALFRDATFVVTNSFHGTAFSVNFEKDFYSYVRPDLNVEGRVASLLKLLGLEDRLFSQSTDVEVADKNIDYTTATAALQAVRAESIQYLRSVLYE